MAQLFFYTIQVFRGEYSRTQSLRTDFTVGVGLVGAGCFKQRTLS